MEDKYYTIEKSSEGFFKDRGSKFLAFAYPIKEPTDVKQKLESLKNQFYDARHHCYAYVTGYDSSVTKSSDDGEPRHSAGDPILGQIRSHDLTNVLVVVVRYFGGTRLGVSGLINAYRSAAQEALSNARKVEKHVMALFKIKFAYAKMNDIMKIIHDEALEIKEQRLEMECEMVVAVRKSKGSILVNKLKPHYTIKWEILK